MKHGTCTHCGFEREKCQCGKKRNSSGDITKFSHYVNYQDERNMFSMSSPQMYQRDVEANKFFDEILPIDKELVSVWVERTSSHTVKLTEYSRNQHIYGTKRTWSCHDSSRYCFICTLCDFVDVLRMMAISILDLDLSTKPLVWSVLSGQDGRFTYHVTK